MDYICFIPIDTLKDEVIALRNLYAAYGLSIVDIDSQNIAAGFIALPDNKEIVDLSPLKGVTLKAILMNRERTCWVIASLENEIFYLVNATPKLSLISMKAKEFQMYFNKCIKNCETNHCKASHYSDDTSIITRIWENTVN